MKTAHTLGLALCLAAGSGIAPAAEIEPEGNKLVVIGMLDGTALPAFVERINSGTVRTVVFEDSLGGNAEVAEAYARVIRDKGLSTEARGQCQAACAYAFLAGKEHRFARSSGVNALLIPLVRRPAAAEMQAGRWRGEEAPPASSAAAAVSVSIDSTEPQAAARSATLSSPTPTWQPGQGVLFTSTPTLFGRVYNTYWCDGTQGTDVSRCERLSDADPHKLGVLTQ
ncbi:MAG: hypothetical protein ABWZ88_04880 [Variovorax sp.]